MNHPLAWLLLTNTAVATALALAAWFAGRLGRPALAHVLWLLVILKLLSPPLWRVPVTVAGPEIDRPAVPTFAAARAITPTPRIVPSPAPTAPTMHAAPVAGMQASSIDRPARPIRWGVIALIAWTVGALAYLLVAVFRLARFSCALRTCAPSDEFLRADVDALAAQIALARPPAACLFAGALSPMIVFTGLRRPLLVLPAPLMLSLDADQRSAVIAHELAHLRRGDHWIRLLELVATAALWWHPLLWAARCGLRDAEEQCCDAWVVALLPHARRRYADALVDAVQFVSRSAATAVPMPAGATGLGRLGHLRRRLTMIVTASSMPSRTVSRAGRVLVAACLVALPFAPVRGETARPGGGANPATQPTTATDANGDATRRAVQALLAAARDPSAEVQQAAMQSIARFGPAAIPTLVDSLDMSQSGDMASSLLASMGDAAVDPLLASLKSKNPMKRLRTLYALDALLNRRGQEFYGGGFGGGFGGMGAAPGGFAGGFGGEMVMESDGFAPGMPRRVAAPAAPPELAQLASRLAGPVAERATDDNADVRLQAVKLLGKLSYLRPEDESAAKSALAALRDESVEVRRAAAATMLGLAPVARDEAIQALTAAVKDSDAQVRTAALDALGAMGPAAKGATDAIIESLKDPQPPVRIAAARALGAMQPHPEPPVQRAPGGPAPAPGFEGVAPSETPELGVQK